MLLPTLGLVKHGYDNSGADRYTYFAAAVIGTPLLYVTLANLCHRHVISPSQSRTLRPPALAPAPSGMS
jgi:hypothetical protein